MMVSFLYSYWVVVAAYLYGVESTANSTLSVDSLVQYNSSFNTAIKVDDNTVNVMWAIHLFGLLWTSELSTTTGIEF